MILLAGQQPQAAEALAWGLIDRIATDPLAEAQALAADCLAAGPDRVMEIKAMIGGY